MNSNAFTIFFLCMLAFVVMKPHQFYDETGRLKSWQAINFDRVETLYNIYVYAAAAAIISYYVTKKT